MSYEILSLMCRDRSHGKLEYQGNGDYECPVCGLSYHDDDFDNDGDDSECISVYDAVLIWASHGKDEDYTFGYSEDELEDAL